MKPWRRIHEQEQTRWEKDGESHNVLSIRCIISSGQLNLMKAQCGGGRGCMKPLHNQPKKHLSYQSCTLLSVQGSPRDTDMSRPSKCSAWNHKYMSGFLANSLSQKVLMGVAVRGSFEVTLRWMHTVTGVTLFHRSTGGSDTPKYAAVHRRGRLQASERGCDQRRV